MHDSDRLFTIVWCGVFWGGDPMCFGVYVGVQWCTWLYIHIMRRTYCACVAFDVCTGFYVMQWSVM